MPRVSDGNIAKPKCKPRGKPFPKGPDNPKKPGCPSPNPSGVSSERLAQIENDRAVAQEILSRDPSVNYGPPPTILHAIYEQHSLKALEDVPSAKFVVERGYGQAQAKTELSGSLAIEDGTSSAGVPVK